MSFADNENYKDAVRMPIDEHGQFYKKLGTLTAEQKKTLKYHPCYALSFIMHASHIKDYFHIAGYNWGPGNIDELPQGKKLIDDFNKHSIPYKYAKIPILFNKSVLY